MTVEPFGTSMRPAKNEFWTQAPSSKLPFASKFWACEVDATTENKKAKKNRKFMSLNSWRRFFDVARSRQNNLAASLIIGESRKDGGRSIRRSQAQFGDLRF